MSCPIASFKRRARRTSSWKISRRPRRPRRFRSSLRPLFGPVRGTGRGERGLPRTISNAELAEQLARISRRPRRPRRFRSSLCPLFGPVRGTGRGERRFAGDDFKEGGTSDATLDQLQISITRGRVSGRAQDRPLDPEHSRTYSSRSGQAFRAGAWARARDRILESKSRFRPRVPPPNGASATRWNCR